MSNEYTTILKSENPAVINACTLAIMGNERIAEEVRFIDETELRVYTRRGIPHDEVTKVSKDFPDEVITCEYTDASNDSFEIETVEYRNGKAESMGIEPNYMYEMIPLILLNETDRSVIYEKVVSFCRRFDTLETDKDGHWFINWFHDEICFKFEHEGVDGKKYMIEAEKMGNWIYFKVFEDLGNNDWRDITQNYSNEDLDKIKKIEINKTSNMEGLNKTQIKANNPEIFQACIAAIVGKYKIDTLDFESQTKFTVHMWDNIPHDEVKEVSKQFPEEVICCEYSYSSDEFMKPRIVEYRNGEDEVKDQDTNYYYYHYEIPSSINKTDKAAMLERVVSFCRRLDTKTDKDGNLVFDWYQDNVQVRFEHEGIEGKKYLISVTKNLSHLDFYVEEDLRDYLPQKRLRELAQDDSKNVCVSS